MKFMVDGLKVARARMALPRDNGRHVSQVKLAERAGLHWVTVSNIERGKAPNTTLETLGKLATALGVEITDLIADGSSHGNGGGGDDDDEEDADTVRRLFSDLFDRAVERKVTSFLRERGLA